MELAKSCLYNFSSDLHLHSAASHVSQTVCRSRELQGLCMVTLYTEVDVAWEATVQEQHLLQPRRQVRRLLFEGSYYSRAASDQGYTVHFLGKKKQVHSMSIHTHHIRQVLMYHAHAGYIVHSKSVQSIFLWHDLFYWCYSFSSGNTMFIVG